MPSIPVASLQPVTPATIGGGGSDARAESAAYGGLGQLGQGIANIGETLGRIAIDRQQHVNQGILANEDVIRQNTFAEVQKFAADNQSNPQAWGDFAKEKWQEYEEGRNTRQQAEGWGPDVRQRDTQEMQSFQARANILFDSTQNKALINQANWRISSNAQRLMDAGDEEGAKAAFKVYNDSPENKDTAWRQIEYNSIYTKAGQSPGPMLEKLDEKNDKGEPVNFSNITGTQRDTLQQFAKGRLSQERTLFQNGITERRLNGEMIPDSELQSAVASKVITPAFALSLQRQQIRDLAKEKPTDKIVERLDAISVKLANVDLNDEHELNVLRAEISVLPASLAARPFEVLAEKVGNKTSPLNAEVTRQARSIVNEFYQGINVEDSRIVPAVMEGKNVIKNATVEKVKNPDKLAAAIKKQAAAHDAITAYVTARDTDNNRLLHPSPKLDDLRKVVQPIFAKDGRRSVISPQTGTSPDSPSPAAQYKEGQTATNSTTGERYVFKGGKWTSLK